jgi:hypothetical protein
MIDDSAKGPGHDLVPQDDYSDVAVEDSVNTTSGQQHILVPTHFLAWFLRDTAKRALPKKAKRWARPFYVDEELFRIFDRRIQENMAGVVNLDTLVRHIIVSYTDLSDETYSSLDEFFQLATEEHDAESVYITWAAVGLVTNEYHEVTLELVTEKPLETGGFRAPNPEAAGITITVLGATRNWVRSTFDRLSSVVKNTRLSVLFRPLERLRDSLYTEIGGYLLGAMAWYVTFQWTTSSFNGPSNVRQMHKVLEFHTLAGQFDQYIREFYSTSSSPFIIGFITFLLPWFALFIFQLLGRKYLPYLVPRSAINVGLSGRRYREYTNLFKFVIFTVIVGIVLSVVANLVTTLLQG